MKNQIQWISQQLLSTHRGSHVPLDVTGSYERFLTKQTVCCLGVHTLLSRGGWGPCRTREQRPRRKGSCYSTSANCGRVGTEGPILPAQLIFSQEARNQDFLPELAPFKKLSTNSKFLKTMCGPTNVQAKSNKSACLIWLTFLLYIRNSLWFKNAYHSEWFGDIYNYLCTFSEEKPWVRLLECKSQTAAIFII